MHHRVADLREDTIHKMTTRLARAYGTIVIEDLNVAGMGRNRRLSRRVSDAAFGEIRRRRPSQGASTSSSCRAPTAISFVSRCAATASPSRTASASRTWRVTAAGSGSSNMTW